MPNYDLYVICDQCGQPHAVPVSVTIDDDTLHNSNLADVYADKAPPTQVAFMQTNKYCCPHTKRNFPASDLRSVLLFKK